MDEEKVELIETEIVQGLRERSSNGIRPSVGVQSLIVCPPLQRRIVLFPPRAMRATYDADQAKPVRCEVTSSTMHSSRR